MIISIRRIYLSSEITLAELLIRKLTTTLELILRSDWCFASRWSQYENGGWSHCRFWWLSPILQCCLRNRCLGLTPLHGRGSNVSRGSPPSLKTAAAATERWFFNGSGSVEIRLVRLWSWFFQGGWPLGLRLWWWHWSRSARSRSESDCLVRFEVLLMYRRRSEFSWRRESYKLKVKD